jgi:hypothetical protein
MEDSTPQPLCPTSLSNLLFQRPLPTPSCLPWSLLSPSPNRSSPVRTNSVKVSIPLSTRRHPVKSILTLFVHAQDASGTSRASFYTGWISNVVKFMCMCWTALLAVGFCTLYPDSTTYSCAKIPPLITDWIQKPNITVSTNTTESG